MALLTCQRLWIEQFTAWAKARDDVRAALVVGSHGRTDHYPPDEWSDVDVLFVTTEPKRYVGDNAWMHDIGSFWTGVMSPHETFGDLLPVFCGFSVYEGGLGVDFFILSNARTKWMTRAIRLLNRYPVLRRCLPGSVASLGAEAGDIFRHGARVLFDKDSLAEQLVQATRAVPVTPPSPPSRQVFQREIDDFWVGPTRVAAYLRRGQLMAAMKLVDSGKRFLARWMEWHARAKNDWQDDGVSYRLKWIDRWADPRALAALPGIHARYETGDMWRALFEMMDLFRWLAAETADLLGYDYSPDVGTKISAWVEQCYVEIE